MSGSSGIDRVAIIMMTSIRKRRQLAFAYGMQCSARSSMRDAVKSMSHCSSEVEVEAAGSYPGPSARVSSR